MFGKKKIIIFITTLLTIILILNFYGIINTNNTKISSFVQSLTKEQKPKVVIGDSEIFVDIVKTNEEKSRGLSGRKSLGDQEGMLFIFESRTQPSFWMKDMLFPIDIIWIADNNIVDIHKSIPNPSRESLNEQLPLYSSPTPINYVLEVNAGFSDKNNLNIGDSVDFSNL